MNDRETKIPIYIAIIVAMILVAAAGYFVFSDHRNPQNTKKHALKRTVVEQSARFPGAATSFLIRRGTWEIS